MHIVAVSVDTAAAGGWPVREPAHVGPRRRGPCGGVRGAVAALGFGAGEGGRVVAGKRFQLARQQPCRLGEEVPYCGFIHFSSSSIVVGLNPG